MSGRAGVAVVSVMRQAGKANDSVSHLCKHVFRILGFVVIAFIFYSPFGGHWINKPAGAGWDEDKTSASWDTRMWDWDFVDCFYFAMVTMTTVGYGDMPTLRQEMRVFTIFFGAIGVVFVASSINVIADWFSERGRKRFIAKQRVLLADAHRVAEAVRAQQAEEEEEEEGEGGEGGEGDEGGATPGSNGAASLPVFNCTPASSPLPPIEASPKSLHKVRRLPLASAAVRMARERADAPSSLERAPSSHSPLPALAPPSTLPRNHPSIPPPALASHPAASLAPRSHLARVELASS